MNTLTRALINTPTLAAGALLMAFLSGSATGAQRLAPWQKWMQNPPTIPVCVSIPSLYAESNTPVQITLADGFTTGYGDTNGCSVATNAPGFFANLNVRREYLLTVVGTNLQQVEVDLAVQDPARLLSKSGSDAVPRAYTILLDRGPGDSITASTNCTYYSNSWIVEIRDQQGARWLVDDQSNDPKPAPGDGGFLQMGPAKSILTNKISIEWGVSLGRLYDGLAAGRLRLSQCGLSRDAYTPDAIYFAASSTNVRTQVELVGARTDGSVRQVKAFQCFVDVIDPWTFVAPDMADLPSLANRLKAESTGVSPFVVSQLAAATQQALAAYTGSGSPAEPLRSLLLQDLNTLISGPSVYDSGRFAGVSLGPETQFLLAQNPQGGDLLRLNRLLLQDAYPTQLAQRPLQTALNFYLPGQVGANTNQDGVYTNIIGSPFVSWLIQNPSPTAVTNLQLIECRNGLNRTNSLVFNPTGGTENWTLTYGTGAEQRVETRGISVICGAATDRLETNTIRYAGGPAAYKCIEDYHLFPWGWELVQTRTDPEGDNLVTSFELSEDPLDELSYSQPWITRYPDGDWEVRRYNHDQWWALGTLQYVLRPFNGLPADPVDATPENCEVADYWVGQNLMDGVSYATYHYVGNGVEGSQTQTLYVEDIDNGYEGGLQYEAQDREHLGYPDDTAVGLRRLRMPDSAAKGLAGHEAWSEDWQSPRRMMYYQGGALDEASGVFTPGQGIADGPDWRQSVVLYGYDYPTTPYSSIQYDIVTSIDGQALCGECSLCPGRSTREATVFHNGSQARLERSVYTGMDGGSPVFETFQSCSYKNDSLGHTTNITLLDASNPAAVRTIYEASYKDPNGADGELLRCESDETGACTQYTYDSLKRVVQVCKAGTTNSVAAVPSITTNLVYDAYGRSTQTTVSAGTLALTSTRVYDLAGRVLQETAPTGLATNYVYSTGSGPVGQVTTITLPSSATVVREQYRDRRLKSQTGAGVVAEFHTWSCFAMDDMSINADLRENDTVVWGAPDSPRWTVAANDSLSRPSLSRSADFAAGQFVDVLKQYGGWLTLPVSISTSSGKGSGYYELDFDGQAAWTEQGERATATPRQYIKLNGQWFYSQTNLTYLTDYSDEATVAGVRLERLSGFTSPSVLSEVTTIDADTNLTVVTTTVNRASRQSTEVTVLPQSSLNPTRITVNGLLISEATATVAAPTLHYYDDLGRETAVTSPLGFTAYTTRNQFGQVASQTDFTGLGTTYEYYPNGATGAGQLKSQTRSGKKTYYAYTARGELWRTWGDVPYPEERIYSQYGELSELHTYRGGSGWSQANWPANPGSADITTWTYQDTSGLLLQKTDHNGNSVSYTYEHGVVKTRSWARQTETGCVTVTYTYNEYGDVVAQDYNDGTPSVQYNDFNRAGQPRQIIDGSGTAELLYDHASRLLSTEYTDGLLAGITVTNHFDGLHGRDALSVLRSAGDPPVVDPLLTIGYSCEDHGRLGAVSSGPYSAQYTYLDNSDLLGATTCKNNGATVLTTTRSWEYGMRLGAIVNQGSAFVSSHAYQYDSLNRRTQDSLEDGSVWQCDYNDRDELTGARHYWPDWSPVSGQFFGYDYDNIGNRNTASAGGDVNGSNLRQTAYTANALNQYSTITTPGYKDICGLALAANNVTVNGGLADRKAEYFHREISIANSSGPLWTNVSVTSGGANTTGGLIHPASSQALSYDLDGNLTFDGVWVYEWDGENRLITMTMTNVASIANANRLRLEFVYDYQSRRVQKIVKHWDPGDPSGWNLDSDSRFVYDGWNLIAILNSSFSLQTSFMWGQDLSGTMDQAGGVGGLLLASFRGTSTTNCFAAYDGNGNITGLINAADQTTCARYEYSAYGEAIRTTGAVAERNPFRFSTKFCDQESGLVYYGFRYYSPSLGRWIGRDPSEEEGAINLYTALCNSPPNMLDSHGDVGVKTLVLSILIGIKTLVGGPGSGSATTWINRQREFEKAAAELSVSKSTGGKKGKGKGTGIGGGTGAAALTALYLGLTKAEATYRSASAAINVGLGIRSQQGTVGYDLESMMINAGRGEGAYADLDAVDAALLMTGGTAADALVAWDTFEDAADAASEVLGQ